MKYDSSAKKFILSFDLAGAEGPADYKELCPLNIDYDQGETLDTWNDLCSQIANNIKTAIDPTWSVSFKFAKTDPVAQKIISMEYAVGEEATIKTRLVNLLKNSVFIVNFISKLYILLFAKLFIKIPLFIKIS